MVRFAPRIGLRDGPRILLLNATVSDNSVTLSASTLNPVHCTVVHSPAENRHDTHVDHSCEGGAVIFKTPSGALSRKLLREYHNILLKDQSGKRIRVISMSGPKSILGPELLSSAPHMASPSQTAAPAVDELLTMSQNLLKLIEEKQAAAAPLTALSPYVAKQLMGLARSKGEFCPIVAEEFGEGKTATMLCGHLFVRTALEETFKTEPNKCPICRQAGLPTYV